LILGVLLDLVAVVKSKAPYSFLVREETRGIGGKPAVFGRVKLAAPPTKIPEAGIHPSAKYVTLAIKRVCWILVKAQHLSHENQTPLAKVGILSRLVNKAPNIST
jgi:hypothetical protein